MMKCVYFSGVCAVLALASVPASAGFAQLNSTGSRVAVGFAVDKSPAVNQARPVIQVLLRREQKTKRTKRIKSSYGKDK